MVYIGAMPRLLIAFCLLLTAQTSAIEIEGKVIAIADGDTFTLLTADKDQVKIRLAEIDAPESGQPYGNKSKQALSGLIFGKDVSVITQTTDRYGRTVGWPHVDGISVSEEMLRIGAAWVYREYVIHDVLFAVEQDAREAKLGLWGISESQNMPPWQWRREGNQEGAREGCNIKGNINSKGVKIYHAPGSSSYGVTQIDESMGERWFCSEAEAKAEGWRAPRG